MNKETTLNNTAVILPEGQCCYGTCGECIWSEPNEQDNYDRIWCSANHAYYYPYESGSKCSGYRTRPQY